MFVLSANNWSKQHRHRQTLYWVVEELSPLWLCALSSWNQNSQVGRIGNQKTVKSKCHQTHYIWVGHASGICSEERRIVSILHRLPSSKRSHDWRRISTASLRRVCWILKDSEGFQYIGCLQRLLANSRKGTRSRLNSIYMSCRITSL